MNFESDLRALVLATLPLRPSAAARRAELEAKSTSHLLIVYFNWQNRLVHPHPRRVNQSDAFASSLANTRFRSAVQQVLHKIEVGDSLIAHLSTRVRCGWEPGGKSSVRDVDLLLNDWGIHHLHLGSSLCSDGFVARSDEVLAVIFRPGVAYVLDIIKHRQWAASRLVETAVRSWPAERLFLPLVGLHPPADWAEDERDTLRKAGVLGPITVNGVSFVSPTMMSSARTTLLAARQAADTIRRFAYFEVHSEQLTSDFRQAASQAGLRFPKLPTYRPVTTTNPQSFGFGIEEVESGMVAGVV